MIVWIIALGIIAVGVGHVVGTGMYERRSDRKIAETAEWLETEATIQSAAIERLDKYTWLPGFAFSYSVKGEYLSGKFFLKADRAQSDDLINTLLNHKFPVRYDPDDPSAWFIAERMMAGCEIIQRLSADYPPDNGMYRSDGDGPIDLRIN